MKVQVGPKASNWVSMDSVSLHLIHALVVAEDARFYQHFGLDFEEIEHSFKLNWERKAFVRGASTITQQVVKQAFLPYEKSLYRKMREALGAILLELFLTKQEILGWYINTVGFGPGVYGVAEASAHFFDKKPEDLTINESIQLALVLPSPNIRSKQIENRRLTAYGVRRFQQITQQLINNGYITQEQGRRAISTGDFGMSVEN